MVLQSLDPIIQTQNKINKEKRAKPITTYDFSTLDTKFLHDKLKNKLSSIIDFAFKGGNKNFTKLPTNGTAILRKQTNIVLYIAKHH